MRGNFRLEQHTIIEDTDAYIFLSVLLIHIVQNCLCVRFVMVFLFLSSH